MLRSFWLTSYLNLLVEWLLMWSERFSLNDSSLQAYFTMWKRYINQFWSKLKTHLATRFNNELECLTGNKKIILFSCLLTQYCAFRLNYVHSGVYFDMFGKIRYLPGIANLTPIFKEFTLIYQSLDRSLQFQSPDHK